MPPALAAGSRAAHGRSGQAADLPVAQAVEDQGKHGPGGGDLGDVAGFLPAAGDDGVLDGAGDGVRTGPRWMASISAQRSIRDPCSATCPRVNLDAGLTVPRGSAWPTSTAGPRC